MKRLKVIALLGLISIALFTGCSKEKSVQVQPTVVKPIIEENEPVDKKAVSEATSAPVIDEGTPPKEGMVRSRITNEWVTKEQNDTRPVAIMIPNSGTASHYGLSKASILYEANVEGSMTRLMGIFDDWENCDKLGNIRSSRDYFIIWSFEWDAIYIHYGGPFYIDDIINRKDTQNINLLNDTKEKYHFRDSAKNETDNAFTSGSQIKEAMSDLGYSLEYRKNYADDYHYNFAPYDNPNTLEQYEDAISAQKIDMSKCYPVTNCYFTYNEDTGLYERFQHLSGGVDAPHIDMSNNEQLTFKNVIVQNTYHEVRDQKGYLAFQVHDTTRDGWFFTNGKGIHVNWDKDTDYGATRYFDDEGEEIFFNTGKTMVLVIEDGDCFLVDNKVIISK